MECDQWFCLSLLSPPLTIPFSLLHACIFSLLPLSLQFCFSSPISVPPSRLSPHFYLCPCLYLLPFRSLSLSLFLNDLSPFAVVLYLFLPLARPSLPLLSSLSSHAVKPNFLFLVSDTRSDGGFYLVSSSVRKRGKCRIRRRLILSCSVCHGGVLVKQRRSFNPILAAVDLHLSEVMGEGSVLCWVCFIQDEFCDACRVQGCGSCLQGLL